MSTTSFDFGDIVLIQFPYTNLVGSKKRPAIVVSTALYNGSRHDVVLMAVTSKFYIPAKLGETVITCWEAAGLLKPSAAKPVFFTFDQSLVLKRIGTLTPDDLPAIRSSLAAVFPNQ